MQEIRDPLSQLRKNIAEIAGESPKYIVWGKSTISILFEQEISALRLRNHFLLGKVIFVENQSLWQFAALFSIENNHEN